MSVLLSRLVHAFALCFVALATLLFTAAPASAQTTEICLGRVITTLDFTATPTLVSGTALQPNAVYRYSNVNFGIDALVRIVAFNNGASLVTITTTPRRPAVRPTCVRSSIPSWAAATREASTSNSASSLPARTPRFRSTSSRPRSMSMATVARFANMRSFKMYTPNTYSTRPPISASMLQLPQPGTPVSNRARRLPQVALIPLLTRISRLRSIRSAAVSTTASARWEPAERFALPRSSSPVPTFRHRQVIRYPRTLAMRQARMEIRGMTFSRVSGSVRT